MNYILNQIEQGWTLKVYNQTTLTMVYQVSVVNYNDAMRILAWLESSIGSEDKIFSAKQGE